MMSTRGQEGSLRSIRESFHYYVCNWLGSVGLFAFQCFLQTKGGRNFLQPEASSVVCVYTRAPSGSYDYKNAAAAAAMPCRR